MKTRFDETKYWITAGGEAIRLCDMETSHLLNTVKMLLQKPTRTQAMLVIDIERNSRDAAVWVPNPQDPPYSFNSQCYEPYGGGTCGLCKKHTALCGYAFGA